MQPRAETSGEQSLSFVAARVFGELAPGELMSESASRTESGVVEAIGLEPQPNKKGELLVYALVEPMIEEVALVEQPLAEIIKSTVVVTNSPSREQIIRAAVKPIYQTPPVTKSMLESTARFQERFVVRGSVLRSRPLLIATIILSLLISLACLKDRRTSSTESL